MVSGADIARQARTWIGTPYQHQGRLKGQAVDCGGLLVGVARELKLSQVDVSGYAWIPDGVMLRRVLNDHLSPVDLGHLDEGDVLLMTFSMAPQHIAIVGSSRRGDFTIIHSYREAGRVVEHRMDEVWWSRIVGAYRFPGVDGWGS